MELLANIIVYGLCAFVLASSIAIYIIERKEERNKDKDKNDWTDFDWFSFDMCCVYSYIFEW